MRKHAGVWIILRDIALLGAALCLFSLFHHVLPRRGEALRQVSVLATPAPTPEAALNSDAFLPVPTAESVAPTPFPGDFPAFPGESTGGSFKSYQSDTLRIAISQVQENDVTYYVADVWIRDLDTFRTAFAGGEYGRGLREEALVMAAENDALFAVTGDFCSAREKGVVVRNGMLYREVPYNDVCILYTDGVMEAVYKRDFDLEAALARGAWQIWSFGPKLMENGQARETINDSRNELAPRMSVGYYEPGHYCFVMVDGRQKNYSIGMNFEQLSAVFASLGCKDAYNLDGGATAVMMFGGEIVNRPDRGVGRKSGDIICFGTLTEAGLQNGEGGNETA